MGVDKARWCYLDGASSLDGGAKDFEMLWLRALGDWALALIRAFSVVCLTAPSPALEA